MFTLICAAVCGCDSGYRGTLEIVWPESTKYVAGVLDPFSFGDDGRFTYFTVNGVDYTVQDPNAVIITNDAGCTFHITYHADPIFRGSFDQ